MSSPIATLLLPSLLILWQGADVSASAPTPDEIAQAVRGLGDGNYQVRERASRYLWAAGKPAEAALLQAATSEDAEVALRAQRILVYFRYQVYPDTPPEKVALIAQFRYGDASAKQAALIGLRDLQDLPRALALLTTEPDEQLRRRLVGGLTKNLDRALGQMFVGGQWAEAGKLLEMGAVDETGMRNLAAYLLLRDRLEPKLASLQERFAAVPNPVDARLLALLLRAKGDLSAAQQAAEKTEDADLVEGLLFEQGNWKRLAELHDEATGNDATASSRGIVTLGYAAAYHRLAGNRQRFEEASEAIEELARQKPNKRWYCGEALIINEQIGQAVAMLREHRPAEVFDLLCRQRRFREALEVAGVHDPHGPYLPWFAEEKAEAAAEAAKNGRFQMGLCVARLLAQMGEREAATGLFDELAEAANKNDYLSMRAVCEAELAAGLTDRAFDQAALVLSKGWNTSVLGPLFPEQHAAAEQWWKFFSEKHPNESRHITIQRLRAILRPNDIQLLNSDDWFGLVEEAAAAARGLEKIKRRRWLSACGETCLVHGAKQRAREYFEQAATIAPSVSAMVRIADLYAEERQWTTAGQWYRRAWEHDISDPLPLYLQGWALTQAGHRPEGRERMEAARLLPLADADERYDFGTALHRRGQRDEARRQWQVAVHTGEIHSAGVAEAATDLGDALAGFDDLKAAVYWQWTLLRCLRSSSGNLGVTGYLELAHRIHKAKAHALLESGNIGEALAEIKLAQAVLPGEIELALDLVPKLQSLGSQEQADTLFDSVFDVNERACRDFPNSAACHHRLARLAVGCGRRLDTAREHARQAARLEPENPDFTATLVEVCFRDDERE